MLAGLARLCLVAVTCREAYLAGRRVRERSRLYELAMARARATGRTLVVVGDPDTGAVTRLGRAYDCGDVTVDLSGAPSCPRGVRADLTRGPVPGVAADSAVVFVSCVLEYVADLPAAWREVLRMAGDEGNVFVACVESMTITSTLYPGARWEVTSAPPAGPLQARPVGAAQKIGAAGVLGALGALGLAR